MTTRSILLVSFLFIIPIQSIYTQSIFDRFEQYLKARHFQVSYGPQLSFFKKSHIRFVQPKYQRDLTIHLARNLDDPRIRAFFRGEFGVNQFQVNLGMDLSKNYSVHLAIHHITYKVDVNRNYYALGTWDGIHIADSINMRQTFESLEHSNGINLWNIGLKRNIKLPFLSNASIESSLGFMPGIGIVLTATQGKIINPNGQFERFDPGNSLAGFNYSLETSFTVLFKKHYFIFANLHYFQLAIFKAKLDKHSYVNQQLRGSNYGIGLGIKL